MPRPAATRLPARRRFSPPWFFLALPLVVAAKLSAGAQPTAAAPSEPRFVGRAVCAPCHAREAERFRGSHHDRSMQVAEPGTVLGDFAGAAFTYNGVTSAFYRKDGAYFVRTDGPDGSPHDYRVAYTFGVDPLQQYLIELPGGRLQALGIAWDARPKASGGQRWFHLYPDDKVDFRDVLHWTGPAQNWNHMCADCHSTNVHKNFRVDSERFQTTWSEVDVSCEACHGPGSRHVDWARAPDAGDATKGLVVDPAARGGSWTYDVKAGIAHLTGPRNTRGMVVCARCHSRRSQVGDELGPDRPLEDNYILSLLEEDLYHADGTILDEVFEYGSFLQSRMHEKGVICTDCHDPHSGRLRKQGNTLCWQCHQPGHFNSSKHHHHKMGTGAARCVSCHMPTRTYMVVHVRHDHSFRVPRPDLSVSLGTPNACNDCHRDRTPRWAADAVVEWYGPTRTRGPRFASAIAAGRGHRAGAERQLVAVVADPSYPPIVRATAARLLPAAMEPGTAAVVETALRDPDPLVRRAAVARLAVWEPSRRWALASPLLRDPVRGVRLEAVNALADIARGGAAPAEHQPDFARAVAEYRDVQTFRADRAEGWLNLGALDARLGNPSQAQAAYERAIRLEPWFLPPYVNLADLFREQGKEADGERVLRRAVAVYPDAADPHYALGLLLVRQKRAPEALPEFAHAARLAPGNPRYALVHALALDGAGERDKAVAVLHAAQERFGGDRDIDATLAEMSGARSGQ